MASHIGKWRSPVAHSAGGRAVAGSNPVFPTTSEHRLINAGRSYWGDLHLIRESRKITLDEVHAETKIPISVLRDFEVDGLISHEHCNGVYHRLLVAAFAEAVGVDSTVTREAYAAAAEGAYDGLLAARYLSWTRPIPEGISEIGPARRKRSNLHLVSPPSVVGTRKRVDWRIVGILSLIVTVISYLAWIGGNSEPSENGTVSGTVSGGPSMVSTTTTSPILHDTITATIIARYGVLNPILVQVDDGRENPYWVEIGDSLQFAVLNTVLIRGDVDHIALSVAGKDLPIDRFADGPIVLIRRADLEEYLRSNDR